MRKRSVSNIGQSGRNLTMPWQHRKVAQPTPAAVISGHAKLRPYGSPSDVHRIMKYIEHLEPPVDCHLGVCRNPKTESLESQARKINFVLLDMRTNKGVHMKCYLPFKNILQEGTWREPSLKRWQIPQCLD